jgi:Transglycosylase SLT domain
VRDAKGSPLGRYLKRKALQRLIAKAGKAKLAAAGALALLAFLLCLAILAALVGAGASAQSAQEAPTCTASSGRQAPPAAFAPIYAAAAQRFGLGPKGPGVLAAINKVESDYGRSQLPGVHSGTNSAGAAGPMQFLAATWNTYGVDGNGDGVKDVYEETDAVFGAANYLAASGAPQDFYAAIFAYNHADWYVQEILRTARGYGEVCSPAPAQLGQLPSGPAQRVAYVARWIEARQIPYCWGGGHAPAPGPSPGSYCWTAQGHQVFGTATKGLDCSGAVRWLLVLSGYPDPGALRSDALGASFPSGRGSYVTIWSNPDHVFVSIGGADWGTSSSNIAHGPGFGPQSSAGFLASHPPGL